jgi:FkbM family methyltransferase
MKWLKAALARTALAYIQHMPIARGKVRLARALYPLTAGAPVRSVYGPVLAVDLRDTTIWHSLFGNHASVPDVLSHLLEGDVFIDVGANIGLYTILAAQRVGPGGMVIAVEPSRREFMRLMQNIELNSVHNVLPMYAAASERTGVARLLVSEITHGGGNRIVCNKVDNATGDEIVSVPTFHLDQLVSGLLNGDRRRIAIKIDTEGHELHVLKGAPNLLSDGRCHFVSVEIDDANLNSHGGDVAQLYEYMKANGFSYRHGIMPDKHYDECFSRSPVI